MTQQLSTTLVPEWTLGDRLRKARELTGLDAVDFADAIGVHRDTVANYEKSRVKARRVVLMQWAFRTGVDLAWLMTGSAGRDPHSGSTVGRDQGVTSQATSGDTGGCSVLPIAS